MINFKIEPEPEWSTGAERQYFVYMQDSEYANHVYLTNDLRIFKKKKLQELFTNNEIDKYFYFSSKKAAEQAIIEYRKSMEFITEDEFIL